MMARYIWLLGLFFIPLSFASDDSSRIKVANLHLGEALFNAHQGKYFDAISLLEIEFGQSYEVDEFNPDPLHFQANNAGLSVGSIELSYRMPQRAELVIQAASGSNVGQLTQNELAYRLARLYLQKNEPQKALLTINKITDLIPEGIRNDELFLRAQIYMANGHLEDAVKILQELQVVQGFEGVAA